ncbi:MAG: hypothetical protein ABI605_06995 [Rhizobacter sp.]
MTIRLECTTAFALTAVTSCGSIFLRQFDYRSNRLVSDGIGEGKRLPLEREELRNSDFSKVDTVSDEALGICLRDRNATMLEPVAADRDVADSLGVRGW